MDQPHSQRAPGDELRGPASDLRGVHRGARVRVTDTGHGIDQSIQGRVFEPFFTTRPLGEGSGLGLHIVREIIARHDGEIGFESRPGETTFTVSLPCLT